MYFLETGNPKKRLFKIILLFILYVVTRCAFGICEVTLKKMMIILWYTLLRSRINHLLHLACLAITGKQHICMVTRWLFVGYSLLPVVKHFYSRVTQKILSVTPKYSYKLGIQMKKMISPDQRPSSPTPKSSEGKAEDNQRVTI